MSVGTIAAVRKSVVVGVPPEGAFELFTGRIGEWWPVATHSIHHEEVEGLAWEPGEGGRLSERTGDGREAAWARILVWEPPNRIVFTWELTAGGDTEVEVRFEPEGDGTRVELEHRGWEALGDAGPGSRANYVPGWDYVLAQYVTAAFRG